MVYNLNRIKKLIGEFHPELGDIGFDTERPYDVVVKRFGVNVLGRPDLTVNEIERFQDTMRYMGFDPYY